MSTVKIEPLDIGIFAITIDGEEAGRLSRKSQTVWRAEMTELKTYTGREFTGPSHAQAFFDEQLGDGPATYRWTIIWTDGTSTAGSADGALAAYDALSTVITRETSPQRENPRKPLLYTIARADGELSATAYLEEPGHHEIEADAAHFRTDKQSPGLPMHLPATAQRPAGAR